MAEATGLFLADFEENNTSEFDSVTQEGSNTFAASASAALHGSYGARCTFDGTNNDSYGTKAITARTELWARLYFRLDSSFSGNTGYLFPLVIKSGTSNRIYARMIMSGSDVVISRFYYQADSGALYATVANVVVSKGVSHYMELYHKSASAAGANDGIARLYLDGTLVSEVTGIDSDTVTVDGIYSGQRGTIVPTSGSYIDIDDIKIDTAYIGAYADETPAITGTSESTQAAQSQSASGQVGSEITGTSYISQFSQSQSGVGIVSIVGSSSSTQYAQTQSASGTVPQTAIIIDHTSVAKYSDIPQYYIDLVKTRWFNGVGESHSMGPRIGLDLLNTAEPKYAANVNLDSEISPESPTAEHLRVSKTHWGDLTHEANWRWAYGEEDWWTSDAARVATKRHIQYCHDNGWELSLLTFCHCWDFTWHSYAVNPGVDPVYKCRWYGSSVGGPDGDLNWGLDDEDYAITGNRVNLDLYLAATQEYVDYCAINAPETTVAFSTGPVDGYEGERGYQRHLKHERIRAYVEANGGLLFDYADILAWDNAGSENLQSWTDTVEGSLQDHQYQMIAEDNMLDLDGTYVEDGDHIGQRGALRLAKAIWVMMAMVEGWDGEPLAPITGESITSQSAQSQSASGLVSIVGASITSQSAQSQSGLGYLPISGTSYSIQPVQSQIGLGTSTNASCRERSIMNVSGAIRGWTRKRSAKIVTKTVTNAKIIQTAVDYIFDINIQPLQAEKVNRKPEDQRSWKWFQILTKNNNPLLKIDDVIIVCDIAYRIESVQNWSSAGYIRYEAHEDYVGVLT